MAEQKRCMREDANHSIASCTHECRDHYIVVRRLSRYVVIKFFCLHVFQWEYDVMKIEEFEAREACIPTPREVGV